jgi:hypothetical protein
MEISPVYQTEHYCGECKNHGFLCQIITANNGWRFIVCSYNEKCFNDAVRQAREIDIFLAKPSKDKLKYFASDETEDAYTKQRLRNEYHEQVQDEVLLELVDGQRV